MSVYLFDLGGEAIAFRRDWNDPYVFDLAGHWIGYCPWGDNDVVDPTGHHVGSIVVDRLVRRNDRCERDCTHQLADPGEVQRTGAPQRPMSFPNRFAYEDIA